jgi:hypothetical protein
MPHPHNRTHCNLLQFLAAGTEINPPEEYRSYSGAYGGQWSNVQSSLDYALGWGAWVPHYNNLNQWMQIDIGDTAWVSGVVTQGRHGEYNGQYVTSFNVQYSESDGVDLIDVNGTFTSGQSQNHERYTAWFPGEVQARYIRFKPQTWNGGINMRAGVIVANGISPSPFIDLHYEHY